MPTDIASLPSFEASWSSAKVDDDLARWSAFLAERGVTWTASADERAFVVRVLGSATSRSGEVVEVRLSALANAALSRAGDPRRVCRRVAPTSQRVWYVLSPEERRELEAQGHRFDTGASGALKQLATIPITLGVYFAAQYACERAGLDRNVALVVALVAYVLTVRVVRGRWPLQRG